MVLNFLINNIINGFINDRENPKETVCFSQVSDCLARSCDHIMTVITLTDGLAVVLHTNINK